MRQLLVRGSYGDTVLLQLIAANCDSAQFAALVQLLVFPALDGMYNLYGAGAESFCMKSSTDQK